MERKQGWKTVLPMILVFCLILGGCTLKNKTMDEQMRHVVTALNDGDVEKIKSYMLPGAVEEQALEQGIGDILRIWTPVDPNEVKLVGFHKNTLIHSDTKTVTYEADYRLLRADGPWDLRLVYQEAGEKRGLVGIWLSPEEAQKQTRTIGETVSNIVCLVAAVVTIIDILRHKPRRYGWYILLALFSFRFTIINNGALTFYLRIPLGAIVYWCMRRRILTNKGAGTGNETYPVDLKPLLFPESSEQKDGTKTE